MTVRPTPRCSHSTLGLQAPRFWEPPHVASARPLSPVRRPVPRGHRSPAPDRWRTGRGPGGLGGACFSQTQTLVFTLSHCACPRWLYSAVARGSLPAALSPGPSARWGPVLSPSAPHAQGLWPEEGPSWGPGAARAPHQRHSPHTPRQPSRSLGFVLQLDQGGSRPFKRLPQCPWPGSWR